MCLQNCAAITTANVSAFSSPQKGTPWPLEVRLPPNPTHPSLPYYLLSVFMNLMILDISCKQIHIKCGLHNCLSFNIVPSWFIHVVAHVSASFLFITNNISLYGYSIFHLSIPQLMDM